MDKKEFNKAIYQIRVEMEQNKRNREVYEKLEEEHERLRKELTKLLMEEAMKSQEETQRVGKKK